MDDQQHSYGRHHRGEALPPGCTWARETFPFQPGDGMTLIGALSEGGRFAPGSPLEGDGFEPSVPRVMDGDLGRQVPALIAVFEQVQSR